MWRRQRLDQTAGSPQLSPTSNACPECPPRHCLTPVLWRKRVDLARDPLVHHQHQPLHARRLVLGAVCPHRHRLLAAQHCVGGRWWHGRQYGSQGFAGAREQRSRGTYRQLLWLAAVAVVAGGGGSSDTPLPNRPPRIPGPTHGILDGATPPPARGPQPTGYWLPGPRPPGHPCAAGRRPGEIGQPLRDLCGCNGGKREGECLGTPPGRADAPRCRTGTRCSPPAALCRTSGTSLHPQRPSRPPSRPPARHTALGCRLAAPSGRPAPPRGPHSPAGSHVDARSGQGAHRRRHRRGRRERRPSARHRLPLPAALPRCAEPQ